MRISRLELANFRCFEAATVDLSADLVAIYGRNGVGKTTIFDALEFALFGRVFRIGRFDDSFTPLRRVYAGDGETRVKLEADDGQWVSTSLDREGQTTITGSQGWSSHLDLLYGLLVDPDYFPTRRSTGSVEAMFRSTLLLSQDSLRRFVEGGADERAEVLATLAGSAHLHRCSEKAGLVAEEARRRFRQSDVQSKAIADERERTSRDLADRLGHLEEVQRSLQGSASLSAEELSGWLSDAGMPAAEIPQDSPSLEQFVARLHAMCAERGAELQRSSEILSRLEVGWGSHSERLARLRQIDPELQRVREEKARLRRSRDESEIAQRDATDQIQAAKARAASLSALLDALQKRADLGRSQIQTTATIQQLDERATVIDRELQTATAEVDRLEESLSSCRRELANLDERLNEQRTRIEALEALRTSLSASLRNRERLQTIDVEAARIEASRQRYLQDQRSAQEAKAVEEARIERLEAALAELRQSADERSDLVARLKTHVSDSTCPLCGTQHPSLEALLAAVDRSLELAQPALQRLADELLGLRRGLQQITERERAAREGSTAAAATAMNLSREREDLASEISASEEKARRLGVDPDLRAAGEAVATAASAVADLTVRREALERKRTDLDERTRGLSSNRQQSKDGRDRLLEQRAALLDGLATINEGLAVSEAVIEGTREGHVTANEVGDELSSARGLCVELEVRRQRLEGDLLTIRATLSETDRRERALEEENAGLLSRAEEYRELCSSLDLVPEASRENFADARGRLESAREALRRAETSARTYELEARRRALDREREELTRARDALDAQSGEIEGQRTRLKWAEHQAGDWANLLREQVNTAIEATAGRHRLSIERHFKSLIPSPHIFDSVSLEFVDGKLRLGIRYRDRERDAGEPRLYLSNAQANVLAVAIFLSLGSSERWSRLDTLLMDDPVQHLDDLDAVAFLDTLRATALGRFGPRKQIIVSTCNRNLYLMTIKKCRSLEKEGLSFRGISLVDHGLSGPQIIYDVGEPPAQLVGAL